LSRQDEDIAIANLSPASTLKAERGEQTADSGEQNADKMQQ
jgi:hypothetical protein